MRIPIHSLPMPVNSWGWTGIKQCASGKGRVEHFEPDATVAPASRVKTCRHNDHRRCQWIPKLLHKGIQWEVFLPIHGIKSVFEVQPQIEKINTILAVLCERTVDTGHCLRHSNKYYRMIDSRGNRVHYRKGTKVMFIQLLMAVNTAV